jgi:hypothetical protein
MPNAAMAVREMGGLMPTEMTDEQLDRVIEAFRLDLGDETMTYIDEAFTRPSHCSCGAFHLTINDPHMPEKVRGNLLRLVASPFGGVIAARHRLSHFRFGWEGLEEFLPQFMDAVMRHPGTQEAWGRDISDATLEDVVSAIRRELPGVIEMVEASASAAQSGGVFVSHVVTPDMAGGPQQWQGIISRLMLAGATPVRKIIDEWVLRRYGVLGGVVNCCCYPAEPAGDGVGFGRRRWLEQVSQQLTPDC